MSYHATTENTYIRRMAAFLVRSIIALLAAVDCHSEIQ